MELVPNDERVWDQKVSNFFVCVFQEKYMEVVWDILRVVHTPEVSTKDEEGGETPHASQE